MHGRREMIHFQSHFQSPLEEADLVIVPLPYDGTTSFLAGTAKGPEAIIGASDQLEDMEEELSWRPLYELRVHSLPPVRPSSPSETPEEYLKKIEEALAPVPESAVLLGIGGEHSVSVPLVKNRLRPGDTFIVIDAHPDLRDYYGESGHSHACASRRVHSAGMNLIQIALGTISPEEREFLKSAGRIEQFWAWELEKPENFARLLKRLGEVEGNVYLSLDADGLSLSYMPGVGTPIPGGLEWGRLMEVLRAVFGNAKANVRGFDLVEAMPLESSVITEFSAAKIIQKMISFRWGMKKLLRDV
ncbi:agmatinase [bacterium]|nr:MAG: agmatinase [bacterium]